MSSYAGSELIFSISGYLKAKLRETPQSLFKPARLLQALGKEKEVTTEEELSI